VDRQLQHAGSTAATTAREAPVPSCNHVHDDARDAVDFYCEALDALGRARVPFLVGGAWAFHQYADIARYTKDFDIFLRPADVPRALDVLGAEGYRTEVPFPHWLAKAWSGDAFMDLIFNSGNGVVPVDDAWFEHAVPAEVLGLSLMLSPVEEMVWSKSFVIERERCDAADVAHLLRHCSHRIDWPRLVARFGDRWRVLLAHLVLFGFVYPGERTRVPPGVLAELSGRLAAESTRDAPERVCNGTVLSRAQYLVDVERWGYADGRLAPRGGMTADDIARWTAAIDRAAP
jgi:hypothetical protein